MTGPTRPERDGLCACCSNERHLKRCVRKGREVWLCEGCETPVGVLPHLVPKDYTARNGKRGAAP